VTDFLSAQVKKTTMNNKDFVHMHCHTEFSAFDGLNKVKSIVRKAKEMGFPALAITDHGNIGGAIKFFQECRKKEETSDGRKDVSIKPLLGCEFYLARNRFAKSKADQPDGRKGNRHLILIAQNATGYRNLCNLSQTSYVDGFYSDARIDLELLARHSDGLICSSACLSSVVNANLLYGRFDAALKAAGVLKEIFGERFFLEAMFHGLDEERMILPDIIRLSEKLECRIVASNDCHYPEKADAKSQELLMCMSTSRCIKDEKHICFPYQEFYMKSAEEMNKIFGTHPDMLHATVDLASMVDDNSIAQLFGGMRLPQFDTPQEFSSPHDYLEHLAWNGLREMGKSDSEIHTSRLRMELDDVKIAKLNNNYDFATYFLIVRDYINWAKKNGILTGCGRGSGFGSLLLRCIGITYGVDPLEHDLLWERFLGFDNKRFVRASDFGI
jgi:DNA polymerase-3 subunit alpha